MNEDSTTRALAIAELIVMAARAGDDIGDSLSLALGSAADRLGSVAALVEARPGSWEADAVRQLAIQYATTPDGLDGMLRAVPPPA